MVVLLTLLALAMIATGAAAVVFGAPIIQVERGWAMVIAGSIVTSAGLVLLGVALATQRLGRIAGELVALRDRLGQAGRPPDMVPTSAAIASPRPEPAASGRPGEAEQDGVVVGQYASGGNSYVMYADGSVHADTPTGKHRFASLDELRSFVAAGGERTGGR